MAELTSETIKKYADDLNIRLSIQTCTIRAAAEIDLPASNDSLREMLLRILNNPNDPEWIDAAVYYVIIKNGSDIGWATLKENMANLELLITEACTNAIYVLAGVEAL